MKITHQLWISIGFALAALPSSAGTAAFLPGASGMVRSTHEEVWAFDPATGGESPFKLPAELGPPGRLALTASAGHLFLAGKHAVFAFAEDQWQPWWTAPEGSALIDIAYDPKHARLVALVVADDGELQWWVVTEAGEEGRNVFNRRADGAARPVFDAAGLVYFTCGGDVWKGTIEANEPGEEPAYFLEARRLWPIAHLETSDGTPGGLAAREIVPLAAHLVLELSRYGGSGWGDIIRLPNEDPYEKQLPLKWDELLECAQGSNSALSPDGKKAAVYVADLKKWFRIDVGTGLLAEFSE